ncbi:SDR family NAD(P)-dependent oxidoreductase [Acuticoccus mangrovi]|uniref:Glucose 1-dehydrogenase n=1 Tax=Acuticoccus mangrovi TaxID=2796142 RepID=A0A934MEY3_9HYPH|nr:glucose 1-dehydrogenase [Acuticoccus mangrovi]MBJ3774355.1 glucose 1-dehydrogenase [Acuticoccus mangrovi]
MELSLAGQVALVTGASSGLGAHFARTLADAGADVVVAARRRDRLDELCAEIADDGGTAAAVALDVTDPASVVAGFDAATEAFGVPTVVINNAGVTTTGAAIDLDDADWARVVDTNLTGCFTVAREAARRMRAAQSGGSIVNIASILGFRVAGALAHYAAAKAGLVQLTKSLALEWARYGIRVNALAPGYILTDINRDFFATDAGAAIVKRIPQRRLGEVEELDAPLLLLASSASSYMTGSVITVDGGHLVSSL